MRNVGPMPKGWILAPIGELARINPRQFDREPGDEEHVSFVPMTLVEAGSGHLDSSRSRLWRDVKKGYTRFQEDDVLFAKITPCMENAKFALAANLISGRGAGSTEFHVIRPTAAVLPKFILYHLLQERVRREARLSMRGAAGQLRVPPEFIDRLEIPVAPVSEQARIIEEIERQFTRLDAAVAALKRIQANLKRYRAAVLKAACEGRLVPTEAELARREGRSYEPASILLERILAEQSGAVGDGLRNEHLPKRLPEGWTICRSGEVFSFVTSGSRGWAKYYSEDGPLFIRIGNLNPNGVTLDLREPQYVRPPKGSEGLRTRVVPGDILISITAELGSIALVPEGIGEAYINQHIALARPRKPVLPKYLAYYLAAQDGGRRQLEKLRRGATKAGLGLDDIRAVDIPLPPFIEQNRIVAEIERRLFAIEELETQVEANLKRSGRVRQAILKRAFEGNLVPQDSNDEPASALLERIRAEQPDTAVSLRNKSRRLEVVRGH